MVFFALFALVVIITFTNPRFSVFSNIENAIKFNQTRIETWHSSAEVFMKNPIFGSGIGDSENLLIERNRINGYKESYLNKLNEHNQYFQVLNSIGLVGLSVFVFIIAYGLRAALKQRSLVQFSFIFFRLAVICLVENFIVRRAGVVFFSIFYCLLYFPPKKYTFCGEAYLSSKQCTSKIRCQNFLRKSVRPPLSILMLV